MQRPNARRQHINLTLSLVCALSRRAQVSVFLGPEQPFLSKQQIAHISGSTCALNGEKEKKRNRREKKEQYCRVSAPCWDDHNFKKEELESVGEHSKVYSQIVLRCLYLARIRRSDILWSVNKLVRAVTKARLVSYIHHANDYRRYCHVGHTAQHCRLGLFQDSYFAGDLEGSKFTSGRKLCIFGSRTFVPMC